MPCISPPIPTPPPLPIPYTVPPLPIPPIPTQPQFCCQLPDIVEMIEAELPPIPLPPGTLGAGEAAIIAGYLDVATETVTHYLKEIPLECPKI